MIGKRDVEARLVSGIPDSAGRGTPDPDMFEQLPTSGSKPQQSYVLAAQNRTLDSENLLLKIFHRVS